MPLDRSLISGLPAFAGLDGKDLDAILSRARSSRFPKDSEVFGQEEEATSFFLLLSGHIRVVRTSPEGHQVIARYITEGELFGIAIAMGRTTYPASAVAAVDCVVLAWPNSAWAELQSRFPAFGASAYRTIGSRLQETQAQVMEMSTQQVEQRIAHALLRIVSQSGRKTPEGIEIDFPITRQDIAEMTGTTLHTVSRLLSAWEDQGIVRSGRQKVTVTDPHALMLVSEHRRKGPAA
ncbi:Cyclic nucleotide-binding protein [Mesorhizobium prunaredense]|uniref:Cyclic nucleotide-binding protein n=1 Tax=Mesorhizobium prunaredense TaxID=1631249 RepID=A0A1R3VBC4_9HYPH|nr:Crp/Fnr family transcriptional regulator [Mesorhizobium prunaredense]SIT55666.1 Cyclic nucleotide-binding protein [Mesorhizobium prunaredense]